MLRSHTEQGTTVHQAGMASDSARVPPALLKQERRTFFGRSRSAMGHQSDCASQAKRASVEQVTLWTSGSCQNEGCSSKLCVVAKH